MKLQGMLASAATPFDHTGAIYRAKIQHNFEKWSRTSLAGFVIGSLPGEGPLLEAAEKLELVRVAAGSIPEGRTVIADVSAEGPAGSHPSKIVPERSSAWWRGRTAGAGVALRRPGRD